MEHLICVMRWGGVLLLGLAALAVGPALAETTLLDRGYREMYDLRFQDAHQSFREWSRLRPDDPMGPVSDAAAYLFSEFERLQILQSELLTHDDALRHGGRPAPDLRLRLDFIQALERTRELASRALARAPNDSNALLASVLRLGLSADYTALIERRYVAALGEMKAARELAESLLARDPQCFDAYLALGVENYVLSLKPALLRWALRLGGARTDRDQGIKELRVTAEKGRYLQPYARLLLAVAALRDHNRRRAAELLRGLAAEFPGNPLYARELERLG